MKKLMWTTACALAAVSVHAQSSGVLGGSSSAGGQSSGCGVTMSCPPSAGGGGGSSSGGQCSASPGGSTCGSDSGPASTSNGGANTGANNPINVTNGNKYQREVDMPALPGVLGLELVRHYNSLYSTATTPTGNLGRGWKLSYETQLYVEGNTIQVVQADGTRHIFDKDPHNPSLCSGRLASAGQVRIEQDAQGTHYRWVWRNGRALSFDSRGLLEQIRQPSGEFVSLQYDRNGRLLKVTDPQGRSLVMNYLPLKEAVKADRFRGIQSIDTPVGRYTFDYGSPLPAGSPHGVAVVLANLVKVHGPQERSVRLYHYEDARFPTLMTGVSMLQGGGNGKAHVQRLATYAYDQRGWAVRSERGAKIELLELERASINQNGRPGRVVLVHSKSAANPQGLRLEVRSAQIAGYYRIMETRGQPCPAQVNCPEANVRYGYDGHGQLTLVTKLDDKGQPVRTEHRQYDSQQRLVQVGRIGYIGGKAQPERMQVRYGYEGGEGNEDEPTLVAWPSVVPGKEHQIRLTYNDKGQPTEVTESGWSPAVPNQAPQALSRTATYRYRQVNGRSLLTETDGPLPGSEDAVRYEWDGHGDYLIRKTYAHSLVHRYEHDETGRIVEEVPPDGIPIKHSYLPTGEETLWQRGQAQAKVAYDDWDRPTQINLPDGEVRHIAYSGEGAVAMATNTGQAGWLTAPASMYVPRPSSAMSSHEAEDVKSSENGSAWREQQWLADDFGRLVALHTQETGWETRRYDEADHLTERHLADGTVWHWQRDGLGRIQWHEVSRPGAATQRTLLRYEGVHLVSIEHPNESERYAYDALGRMQTRSVLRKGLSYTERYEYDQADRLTVWHLPEGGALRYRWGVGQQLTSIEQDDGRASAVLGERLSRWLGLGYRQIIAPLPIGPVQPSMVAVRAVSAAASQASLPALRAQLQAAMKANSQVEQGYRWGNGIELRWRLDDSGHLTSMRYVSLPSEVAWHERLLAWMPSAHAAASEGGSSGPRSLIELAYRYDDRGRMSERIDGQSRTGFAYDEVGRLIVAQHRQQVAGVKATAMPAPPSAVSPEYYTYGPDGLLLGSQVQGQNTDWRTVQTQRDASGLPQSVTGSGMQRLLRYSADRRLIEVREQRDGQGERLLAAYSHNTNGQRISKTLSDGQATSYLWSQGQLVAETATGAHGPSDRLARRYVYAHGVPVAVIDYTGGQPLLMDAQDDHWGIQQALSWVHAAWRWARSEQPELTYVHANEIGTPIAATDAKGHLTWQADYSSYGLVTALHTPEPATAFTLNLRLPGQYFDKETGWYNNGLRTYDPQRGEYLEPDPLGPVPNWRSGRVLTQPYAYANHNPLIYADPTGLILFAFDGTGNSDPAQSGSALSNVVKFRGLYLSDNKSVNYITGVGTKDPQSGIDYWGPEAVDMGLNYTGPKRIDQMVDYFNKAADSIKDSSKTMEVDIVGFSRGAAEARDFANRIVANTKNGVYSYQDAQGKQHCQKVDFRFMGLWDTVLSNNQSGHGYNAAIPSQFTYVAQAVALDEFRGGANSVGLRALPGSYGNFPLESIMNGMFSPVPTPGKTRIERGFLGSHSDIGGGYAAGQDQLAQVSLAWMIAQAKDAGVEMQDPPSTIMANPIVHDKSDNQYARDNVKPSTANEDRQVLYMNGTSTTQKQMVGAGMTYEDTLQFIKLNPASTDNKGAALAAKPSDFSIGTVDMAGYLQWLRNNGYDLGNLQAQ